MEQPTETPKKVIEPPKPIEKEKSMVEEIKELKEFQQQFMGLGSKDLTKKNFKIPGKVKRQTRNLKKLAMKSKVQVLLLTLAGDILPTIGELKMGMLIVGDKYHNGIGNITWRWNGKIPTCIVPEWDLQPVTKETLVQNTEELKTHIHPQTITLRAIEAKEALDKAKQPFNFKGLLIIAAIGLVAYFIFFRGG